MSEQSTLLRDLANDSYVKPYNLEPYYPPVAPEDGKRSFTEHEVFHCFLKSRGGNSAEFANNPKFNTELLVDIYEVILKQLKPQDGSNAGSRQQSVKGTSDTELSFEQIKDYIHSRRQYLESLFDAQGNPKSGRNEKVIIQDYEGKEFGTISNLSDHIIGYHIDRAKWFRDNIRAEYGKPYHEMAPFERGDVDLEKVTTRETPIGLQTFEENRVFQELSSENIGR